jgi:hypothetical protein
MSDEVLDPVVEPVAKEDVSPQAEDTTPKPDQVEVPDKEPEEPRMIPKERFDQVWARSKKAEEREKHLQTELQREREERIRLEERAKVQQEQQTQKEYTWAELENFIAEGKLTRDQAQEYKDKQTEQRLERKFKAEREQYSSNAEILNEIEQYKKHIPDVMEPGSESRLKYEQEYSYLVTKLKYPANYATQLAATRAAFGDLEKVKKVAPSKQTLTSREPFMETHTPQPSKQMTKSFKDTLPDYKVKHYEKMMKSGLVKDWKGVEELEKWTPKLVRS